MELLNRYVHAVGHYLPAETKNDTLAELRANLLAQIEGREEELGRPLNAAEASAILKAHGRPEFVAARYLPQRWLIGPTVFPIYLFTLKRAFPAVVLIYAVVRGTVFALSPEPADFGHVMGQMIFQIVPVLWTFLSVMTAVFAAIEYGTKQFGLSAQGVNWEPGTLPPVAAPAKKPTRLHRVADAIVHWVLVVFLLVIPRYPFLILGPGAAYLSRMGVSAAGSWMVFYWWFMGGMVIQLALKMMDLGRQPNVLAGLLGKIMSVVTLGVVVAARVYFVSNSGWVELGMLNYGINLGFRVLLVISVVDLGWAVWKAVRDGERIPRVAGRALL